MSYSSFLEDGSGKLGVRVSVPGLDVEFVSEPSMERTTADGRRRIYCLAPIGEGIVLEEKINIPDAMADVTSNRITLNADDAGVLDALFNSQPATETYLQGSVFQNGTQLEVMSEAGFAAGDVVHLGTEAILIASVSGGLLHVQSRGYWDTQAQAHYSNDAQVPGALRVVSSAPARIRGRRLRVYLYGEGDDPQGDGTQVWLGKVTSDATLSDDGTVWSFGADNILSVLRTKLGTEIEGGIAPRGAYYHWAAPLTFEVFEDVAGTPHRTSLTKFFGFYETQREFLEALAAAVQAATAVAGVTTVFGAVEDGASWTLTATIGAGVTTLNVLVQSPVDGESTVGLWLDADGNHVSGAELVAGDTVTMIWNASDVPGLRSIPRGIFGLPPVNFDAISPDYADETKQELYPDNRIYLSSPVASDWTAVQIKWPNGVTSGFTSHLPEDALRVEQLSIVENWIMPRAMRRDPGLVYTSQLLPEIKAGRTIAVGSLADFIAGLTHDAPTYANRLTLPAIWESDFSLTDLRVVIEAAAAGRAFLRRRIYTIFSPTDVDKLIAAESQLLNVYPCLDDDGTITFRRFEIPNASTTAIAAIDDEVWQAGALATLAPEDQGTYNVVKLKTGYSASDNKHTGREFIVRDVRAIADEQEQHALEISPQSTAQDGDTVITEDAAASIVSAYLGYFASPYKVVQNIAVTWQLFPLRCGDAVSISTTYLPAFDGLRPMTDVVGIIVSRRFALGQPFGTFDVIVSPQNVAGYAPVAFVDAGAFANVAGNTWDITITTDRYAPEGTTEDEFFITGDLVRLVQYDNESPTEYTGTVVTSSAGVIRVAFTGALASPGSSEWWLHFQSYSALTTAQRVYCVIAENSGRIGDAVRARTFAA
jgi:hypothetical protein